MYCLYPFISYLILQCFVFWLIYVVSRFTATLWVEPVSLVFDHEAETNCTDVQADLPFCLHKWFKDVFS